MLVDISAAGFPAAWDFPGSKRFEVWAQQRPWANAGGICVLRVSDEETEEPLSRAVERASRGYHGNGNLDVRRVQVGGSHGGPFEAILSSLEIDPNMTPMEAREPLSVWFADRQCLFLLSEDEPVESRKWEAFVALVDHFSKSSPVIRLCVAVLDRRQAILSDPAFDFTSGRATHLVLAEASELEEAALWQRYLHHRACWESGGRPGYAIEVGYELADCAVADDDAVEAAMNRVATSTAAAKFDLDVVLQQVDAFARGIQASGVDPRTILLDQRVLWRPPGMRRFELVPWLSRALLISGNVAGHLVWSLRHNLVCTPLAGEVLGQCLHSESQIRMRIDGRQDPARIPITARENFDRFCRGEDAFAVYPASYPMPPSRPQDIWAFATLGEALNASPRGAVADLFYDVLKLRNSMAHGHYVGWEQVRLALQQLRRFDRR